MIADEVRRLIEQLTNITIKKLNAGGWRLLDEIEGYDRLIVIDAFFSHEGTPGRLRIHQGAAPEPACDMAPASAHLLTITEAVALSKKCGYHTPKVLGVITVDIGENCLIFGTGLTPAVAATVPHAAKAVLELIETA